MGNPSFGPSGCCLSSMMVWAWTCPYSATWILWLTLIIVMTPILSYATSQMIHNQTIKKTLESSSPRPPKYCLCVPLTVVVLQTFEASRRETKLGDNTNTIFKMCQSFVILYGSPGCLHTSFLASLNQTSWRSLPSEGTLNPVLSWRPAEDVVNEER